MNRLSIVAVLVLAMVFPSVAAAGGGDPDMTFGNAGYVMDLTDSGKLGRPGDAVLVGDRMYTVGVNDQADGLIVATTDTTTGTTSATTMDHSTFHVDSMMGDARATLVGNRLFVAVATQSGADMGLLVVAFDATGTITSRDTGWATDGWTLTTLTKLASGPASVGDIVSGEGATGGSDMLWIAGHGETEAPNDDQETDVFFVSLRADGSLVGEAYFDRGIEGMKDRSDRAIGIRAAFDRAYVGYASTKVDDRSEPIFGIVTFNEDGTGGTAASVFSGAMNAMYSPAGSNGFVFAGALNGTAALARLAIDQTPDTAFGTQGITTFPALTGASLHAVAEASPIQYFVAAGTNETTGAAVAVAVMSNGTPVAGFGSSAGTGYAPPVTFTAFRPAALLLDATNRLLMVGGLHAGFITDPDNFAALRVSAVDLASGSAGSTGSGSSGSGSNGSNGGSQQTTNDSTTDNVTEHESEFSGLVVPALPAGSGAIYQPSKVVRMPKVQPAGSRFRSVVEATAMIDRTGLRATYRPTGVARSAVPAAYRSQITAGDVFAQSPAPGTRHKVTLTSPAVPVALRYYDPSKDPKDPVCDYAGANRELTDLGQSPAMSWLRKNRCEYVLHTIPTRRATDRYVLRAKVERSSLPGGKILVVDLAEPVIGDLVLGFREPANAGATPSFDVRDWALTAGAPNVFTVQVIERSTGRFVHGAVVEVSSTVSGGIASGLRRRVTDANGEATFILTTRLPGTLNVDATVTGRNGRTAEGYTDVPVKTRSSDLWTTGGRHLVRSGSGWRLDTTRKLSRHGGARLAAKQSVPAEYARLDSVIAAQVAPIIRLAQVKALAFVLSSSMRLRLEDATRIAESAIPPVETMRNLLAGTGMSPTQLINGGMLKPSTSAPGLLPSCPALMSIGGAMRQVSATCVNLNPGIPSIVTAGAGVIAAGGGNVVSAGGANVVSAGGANVVSAGGANVVSAGGANVVSAGGRERHRRWWRKRHRRRRRKCRCRGRTQHDAGLRRRARGRAMTRTRV